MPLSAVIALQFSDGGTQRTGTGQDRLIKRPANQGRDRGKTVQHDNLSDLYAGTNAEGERQQITEKDFYREMKMIKGSSSVNQPPKKPASAYIIY